MNKDRARREYELELPRWQELAARLRSLIEVITRDEPGVVAVTHRVKSFDSILAKVEHLDLSALAQVQDIVGVRILVQEYRDVARLKRRLAEALDVQVKDDCSWRDEPRYRSVHLTLAVGEDRESLVEWQSFAGLRAEIQILTSLAFYWTAVERGLGYELAVARMRPTEPSERLQIGAELADRLNSEIDEFEALLDQPRVQEKRDIHPFLGFHQFLLHPNPDAVWSEVPIGLGTEYRIDFVIRESDGGYVLVEIENPRHNMFNKNGDFAHVVGHAQLQVEKWQEWIEDNLPTMQKRFAGISSPRGFVVIGRSRGWDRLEKRRLARRNANLAGRLAIVTYDDLIAGARSYVAGMKRQMQQ